MRILIVFFVVQLFNIAYSMNLDFFSKFNDCYLENYIKEALLNNHDLKQANHRLEQYRYEINKAYAQELPSLSVSPSYLGTHFPNNDYNIFLKRNSFILPFKVNFEPDFLFKNKDKIESTKKLYKAQQNNTKSTYLTLLTDVATTYTNILLYDYLIKVQKEILENKEKNLTFDFNKFRYGIIDSINLNNTNEDFYSQKLIYETLIKNRNTSLYNLSLLLGRSADNISELERGYLEKFEYIETIPDIINSDLIYFRPDVLEVENQLKSARIDVTVAKKDFFPSFNITGLLTFDTAGGGNFFSWGSSFAYLLANATQDIFKGGAKIANLKIKQAKFNELMEKYLQVDLIAIKEINNALNIIKQDSENEKNSKEQLELEYRNFIATDKKYKRGTVSKADWLNNRNSYNQQRQISATSKANRLVDYFTLYKATGGAL